MVFITSYAGGLWVEGVVGRSLTVYVARGRGKAMVNEANDSPVQRALPASLVCVSTADGATS